MPLDTGNNILKILVIQIKDNDADQHGFPACNTAGMDIRTISIFFRNGKDLFFCLRADPFPIIQCTVNRPLGNTANFCNPRSRNSVSSQSDTSTRISFSTLILAKESRSPLCSNGISLPSAKTLLTVPIPPNVMLFSSR